MNENAIFERFLSPSTMIGAEQGLLALREQALPILESLLSGDAKNRFGVPYRTLGLPLRCTLEVADRLGPVAKPLEQRIREELKHGNHVAAMALGSIGQLEKASVIELAVALKGDVDLAAESAQAIVKCGMTQHPAVLKSIAESPRARDFLVRVTKFLGKRA